MFNSKVSNSNYAGTNLEEANSNTIGNTRQENKSKAQ